MKALIIEDEVMAAKSLKKLLVEVSPGIEIVGMLESIEDSVEWIANHPMPDLMFMDIHLADGSSFAIFERVTITCPVIFTTAYDEYALKAFEVNKHRLSDEAHQQGCLGACHEQIPFVDGEERRYQPDQHDSEPVG